MDNMAGATGKYSEEIVQKLEELISSGVGQMEAARAVGIHPATLFQWKYDHAPEFPERIKKAQQLANETGREAALKAIFRAMDGNQWQAGAWFLERVFPEEYGKRDTTPPPQPITINVERVSAKRKEADNEAD